MTITLLGQSPQVGATWFAGGSATPVTVRPVGEPPSAIWFLSLPPTNGKLVVHMWFPVVTTALGRVTQERGDYKVAIRRVRTRPSRRTPAPDPPIAQTFGDSG